MKIETKVERLLKVVEVLDALPTTKKFHMESWKEETLCGIVGCAAGWAASDPWFKKRGLTLQTYSSEANYKSYSPIYQGAKGFDALVKFFGLDMEAIDYLFDTPGTKKQVIERITRFARALAYQAEATKLMGNYITILEGNY